MKIFKTDYSATGAFSALITDYLAQDPKLQPFYNRFPALENFGEQVREKQQAPVNRELLCSVLHEQYANIAEVQPLVQQNIKLLGQPNTFTVTTGHQLNIFTGPLYFVYKIISAINTCKRLNETYPDYNFVPVYWMATEDHDFAEVNHFNLFGKKYTWESNQTGAVGRFSTADMAELLSSLPEACPVFTEAYANYSNLTDATRAITHALFGAYGLVSLDGDHPALKQVLQPVVEQELTQHTAHQLVTEVSEKLAAEYKAQVMSREINFFYLDTGRRERIVREGDSYKVLNTDLVFSEAEILKLAAEEPDKFSPNVILRPLYQEMVLPNLAYIGGGAEVNYWFQLKPVFEAYGVPYPMVMLRNSALYINKASAIRRHKLNLQPEDLFKETNVLKKQITAQFEHDGLSLAAEKEQIENIFQRITQLAASIDPTLEKTVAAERQKTHNALEVLEKKIVKANDTKYETHFNQLNNLKEKLFPGGTLQERTDNLLTYKTNNPEFIEQLLAALDPLEHKFTVLEEE
ncbi:putative cysteine ligase BshC [Adhaeribacter aerolatus]|uniref:Putative cysteine ligase BshC n=1 Tax=Adhaeribacter aerolatus TaxID=670289 RepID=A0A512B181_9BACT|nr:bacillithiol biosynthesis cysteine-adding enzyme BshC [Adhaeribacter aerolatus]GEO05709.1 putative cysteine ligase BshC [Adhaeribacter aerolatus]